MAFTPTTPISTEQMERTSKQLRELATGKLTPSSFLQMFTILQTMLFPDAGLPEIDGFEEASMSSGSSQASSPTSSTTSQAAPLSPDHYSLRPAPPRIQITPATPKTSKPGQMKSHDGDQEKDGFRSVTAKRRRDPESPKLASEGSSPPAKTITTRPLNLTPLQPTAIAAPSQSPASPSPTATTIPFIQLKVRIPPIMLHRKADYRAVKRDLMLAGIRTATAKDLRDFIRHEMTTADDYRRATKMLAENSIPFHSYALAEEKTLKAVVAGIPLDYTEEQILEIYQTAGYPIIRA